MGNMTIWKYTIRTDDVIELSMPINAKILCIQLQEDSPCMWVLVDPYALPEKRRFHIFRTGHDVPLDIGSYVGTYQFMNGKLVFHVFEENSK